MRIQFVVGILILLLATCSSKGPAPTGSGVEGQVLIGPMCPAVQEGQECPDQPYQAVLTVNSPEGRRIVQIQADEQGRFRIPLEPGEYILLPESLNALPFAGGQSFVVETGRFTRITVKYDSGIR
jgi:hypothetical protein